MQRRTNKCQILEYAQSLRLQSDQPQKVQKKELRIRVIKPETPIWRTKPKMSQLEEVANAYHVSPKTFAR